uniref:EB domain-containing protein n=1 Tax=Meloidogyne floridensis TaxID=298350 RepID=A0A915P5Z5_9BILA
MFCLGCFGKCFVKKTRKTRKQQENKGKQETNVRKTRNKFSCQNLNSWDGNLIDQNDKDFENKYINNQFPKLIEWPKEGQIGSHCNPDLNGACIVPNSHCFKGICECLPMYYPESAAKCEQIDPASSLTRDCIRPMDCPGNGEFCNRVTGKCECVDRFVEVDWRCLPGIPPGDFGCIDSRQCSIFFSTATCSGEEKCHCPEGMVPKRGTCLQEISGSNIRTKQSGDHIIIPSVYPPPYQPPPQPSSNGLPRNVCSTDSSCAGYPLAFCDGVCKCREGALNAGSACIAALENGAIMGGTCSNGQVETT